jgi:hypothetical protein
MSRGSGWRHHPRLWRRVTDEAILQIGGSRRSASSIGRTQNEPLHRLGETLVIVRVCGSVGLLFLVLAANERAERYFARSEMRGRLRFGASEDFVKSLLPEVSREFVRTHPLFEFELTVG